MHRFRKRKDEAPPEKAAVVTETGSSQQGSEDISNANVEHDLNQFVEGHAWDPNLDRKKMDDLKGALGHHDTEAEAALEHELEENSPYPEVVAAVQNWDDSTLPASTIRAWLIGMTFVTIGSG